MQGGEGLQPFPPAACNGEALSFPYLGVYNV